MSDYRDRWRRDEDRYREDRDRYDPDRDRYRAQREDFRREGSSYRDYGGEGPSDYGRREWSDYGRGRRDYERDYRGERYRGPGGENYPITREYGRDWPSAGGWRSGEEQGYEPNYGARGFTGDYGYGRGAYGRGAVPRSGFSGRPGEERGWWDRTADEISSWFGDEDAARRREEDQRRDAMHRGRGPRGYARSDDRIREDVSDRLTDDPYVDASEIDVSVSNGEVTLSGTVDNRSARRRAEDIAESVSGVRHVQNNLRARQQQGTSSMTGGSAIGTQATGGLAGASSTTSGATTSGLAGTGTATTSGSGLGGSATSGSAAGSSTTSGLGGSSTGGSGLTEGTTGRSDLGGGSSAGTRASSGTTGTGA
ncbi:MAG: BON domain-containing protein [Acetobacteraceae bacterium]|nr:BON domain-containing protein [Acetobacteraceae bacterium]